MKKKLIIILFIILNFSQKTEARSQRNVHGSFSIDDIQKNLFFDVETERNLYETSQKIPIKFIVKNVGYHTFRFYVDQNFGNTFFLEIINEAGEEIQNNVNIKNYQEIDINQLKQNKTEDHDGNPIKEILLHPEEVWSKTFYIDSLPKGKYKIVGYFIPYSFDMQYKNNLRFLSKSRIHLQITEEKSIFVVQDSIDIAKDSSPSPEEIVYLFLMAEYYKNWENYFKYLELKEYIKSYELFEKEYQNASTREKQLILNEFKNFLMKQEIEPIIEFKIKKVVYHKEDLANVYAEVLRGKNSYRVRYLYNYTLQKRDYWKIYSVVVSILKTGK